MFKKKRTGITPGDRTVPQLRTYGHAGTIHQTTQLDVEVDKNGEVIAVWFRCQLLPFRQSNVDDRRANELRGNSDKLREGLVAVELEDLTGR